MVDEVAPVGGSGTKAEEVRTDDGARAPDRQWSGYRRRRAGPATDLTAIKGILSKALAIKGLDKKIERYEFILHWEEIVGDVLATVCKPECISGKSLILRVAHSAWAQEITFQKAVILQRLRPFLRRGDFVDDIVCRVGNQTHAITRRPR